MLNIAASCLSIPKDSNADTAINIPKKNKGKPNLSKKIREDLIEADIPDPLPVNFEEQLLINEQDESATENEGDVDENGDEENCQNEFDTDTTRMNAGLSQILLL